MCPQTFYQNSLHNLPWMNRNFKKPNLKESKRFMKPTRYGFKDESQNTLTLNIKHSESSFGERDGYNMSTIFYRSGLESETIHHSRNMKIPQRNYT